MSVKVIKSGNVPRNPECEWFGICGKCACELAVDDFSASRVPPWSPQWGLPEEDLQRVQTVICPECATAVELFRRTVEVKPQDKTQVPEPNTERFLSSRPIQIQATSHPGDSNCGPHSQLFALCKDGSIWLQYQSSGRSNVPDDGLWRMIQPPEGFRIPKQEQANVDRT